VTSSDPRLRRAYGHSLAAAPVDALDIGRDLQLARGPRGLDLARVEGVNNLGQALSVALTTALGSDVFNVDFGFGGLNALAEETHPLVMRERVRVSVIQLLRADARVRDIIDVKFADGRLDGLGAGTRTLEVRVVFETVGGERLTLDLGRGDAGA
jgi:hypothetical protein